MAKYKNTKQIAKSAKKEISDSKLHKYLIAIPLMALTIKMITMFNIEQGGWLGADGENYLTGVDGLLAQGFFSTFFFKELLFFLFNLFLNIFFLTTLFLMILLIFLDDFFLFFFFFFITNKQKYYVK